MLIWYPKATFLCLLLVQQHLLQNVQQERPSQRYLNFVTMEYLRDTFQCRHSTTILSYTFSIFTYQ